MRRGITALIGLIAILPVVWVLIGSPMPWAQSTKALTLSSKDREFAWLHTTTNAATWERFVTGIQRAALDSSEYTVNDLQAFPNDTTTTPEVVISKKGSESQVFIRWYKLSNDATPQDWVRMLAMREQPPLAIIGGGSTDRATDLAKAMAEQKNWNGPKPLLFITTATADQVPGVEDGQEISLVNIYEGRTFRFCFTNRQMAEATADFIWTRPELRPGNSNNSNPNTNANGNPNPNKIEVKPLTIALNWDDDLFSLDLNEQFRNAIYKQAEKAGTGVDLVRWQQSLPFSIGGTITANRYERRAAEYVVSTLKAYPGRRALLILPTVTAPARRVLRSICDLEPNAGERLVVVAGDGIPINAVYRDGPFSWPIERVPIPLVLFSHAQPFGWDNDKSVNRNGYDLMPPTSTEDVLHFRDIMKIALNATFDDEKRIVSDADDFLKRLKANESGTFESDGNRQGGSGEFVVIIKPKTTSGPASLTVWRHLQEWEQMRSLRLPIGGAE